MCSWWQLYRVCAVHTWRFRPASWVLWDARWQALMLLKGQGHVHLQLVYFGIHCTPTCGHSTLILICVYVTFSSGYLYPVIEQNKHCQLFVQWVLMHLQYKCMCIMFAWCLFLYVYASSNKKQANSLCSLLSICLTPAQNPSGTANVYSTYCFVIDACDLASKLRFPNAVVRWGPESCSAFITVLLSDVDTITYFWTDTENLG